MNKPAIRTISRVQAVIVTIACLALMPAVASAHGDLEHVIGTVSEISETAVSVQTPAGKVVQVSFDDKTTYTRAKQAILRTGIKVGDRIVIHAARSKQGLVARTVEAGTASATRQTTAH